MTDDKNEERLAMLEQMIGNGSQDPFHRYARAMALRSLARSEEAAAAFDEVIESFPDYLPSYLMAGQVAEERGDEDRARALYTTGIEVAKRNGDSHSAGELQLALDEL